MARRGRFAISQSKLPSVDIEAAIVETHGWQGAITLHKWGTMPLYNKPKR